MKQLTFNEMLNLKGGISKEEYCRLLIEIIANNDLDEGAMEGAKYGLRKHCL